MYAAEFASTGALETSALHQLSAGKSGPGGDPGNAPPRTACPDAPEATAMMVASADTTAVVQLQSVIRKLPLTGSLWSRTSVHRARARAQGDSPPRARGYRSHASAACALHVRSFAAGFLPGAGNGVVDCEVAEHLAPLFHVVTAARGAFHEEPDRPGDAEPLDQGLPTFRPDFVVFHRLRSCG